MSKAVYDAVSVLDRNIEKEEEYIRIAIEEDSYAREQGFTFASEQKIEALKKARAEIASIPEIPDNSNGWISVEDEKPQEKENNMILTYEEGTHPSRCISEFCEGKWYRIDNENISFFDLWQPLPLPPNK